MKTVLALVYFLFDFALEILIYASIKYVFKILRKNCLMIDHKIVCETKRACVRVPYIQIPCTFSSYLENVSTNTMLYNL